MPESVEEMVTLFSVTGTYVYVYVEPQGKAEKVEDLSSKAKLARERYEKGFCGSIDQVICCCGVLSISGSIICHFSLSDSHLALG